MSSISIKDCQKSEVKRGSRSEMTSWGRPCKHQISLAKIGANSFAPVLLVWRGMKWAIFVNQSTTTQIVLKESLPASGNPVIKSQEIEVHGARGSSREERRP